MGKILGNQDIHDFRDWNTDDWTQTGLFTNAAAIDPIGATVLGAKDRIQAGTRRTEQRERDEAEQRARDAAALAEQGRQTALQGPRDEYKKRLDEMTKQRTLDLGALKSRLTEWGFDENSLAFKTGQQSIFSSYEDKLKSLGSDPYFDQIEKSAGWT